MGFLRILTAAVGAGLSLVNGGTGGVDQASAALSVLPTGTALQQIRKNAGDTAWEAFTPAAAGGDVVGPASAVDNAISRFDTTTGKLIQNSKFAIGDAGAANFFDSSGGNARGADAIDLQTTRASVADVASGARAFIGGGKNSSATAADSAVLTCNDGFAGGIQSAILNGASNQATNNNTLAWGYSVQATGSESTAFGILSVADKQGMFAMGANGAGGAGFAQVGWLLYNDRIASASQVELILQDVAAAYLTLVDGDCYDCQISVLARQSPGVFAAWNRIPFTIQRTGATTSIIGTGLAAIAPSRTDAGLSLVASTLDIEADDTNDRLAVKITLADATQTDVLGWLEFNKVKKV